MASTDKEIKKTAAKVGRETRAQDKESLEEAGRKGGETVAVERGSEFYSEIAKKGIEIDR